MTDLQPEPDAATEPIRVILKPRRAMPFFSRHPWVFDSAIDRVSSQPEQGGPVEVWSAKNEFVAHGFWNSASNIRVRLFSWDRQQPPDDAWLDSTIRRAVSLRRSLFDLTSPVSACRLVFSEADGVSGLTGDLYGNHLLVQFTSLALYLRRDAIVASLQRELQPEGIWLRTEKGMREAEGLEAADGLITGAPPPRPLFIEENGIQFGVDVQEGQKTGCYLDQRDNRLAAAKYCRGQDVLDAFCFSGGFGITAAKVGAAASVLGIDSSEAALNLAAANAELNGVADRCRYLRGDVKAELAQMAADGRKFGTVIIDPPRMARSRSGLSRAVKGYFRLNQAALKVLKPDGILVTCSCSGLVSREAFREMLANVATISGRSIQILEQLGQPPDHPVSVSCPETEYLKVLICRVS
ncbi:MAG: class I SAM-dependent rRNA methyltransferase [Planctomycetaceae bacterium]